MKHRDVNRRNKDTRLGTLQYICSVLHYVVYYLSYYYSFDLGLCLSNFNRTGQSFGFVTEPNVLHGMISTSNDG